MSWISVRGVKTVMPVLLAVTLTACGGGGGGSSTAPVDDDGSPPVGSSGSTWQPNNFLPSETFANQCEAPRGGVDPATGLLYPDVAGTALDEKNWLRSWSHELYLWYREIEDRDPADYGVEEYFDLLVTNELTDSGARKDNFHFYMPTDEWQAMSQSGVSVGYGVQWAVIESRPPREIRVAYRETDAIPGLPPRGAEVVEVNGVDVVWAGDQESVNQLNAGFFPDNAGQVTEFTVRFTDGSLGSYSLESREVIADPVQHVKVLEADMGRRVGYLLFNDHIATAEKELRDAIDQLAGESIDDLVIDLRYNGGGYLAIASQLAYMIAGNVPTAGRTFEQLQFNDKYSEVNPVTGKPLDPIPFYSTTLGFSELPSGQPLPSLGMARVYVLTGGNTCSASEAIINGLRGVDIEVIQIGNKTCGKPYGFYPTDNCGTTWFTIQFQGVNEKNFGEYSDGFVPAGAGSAGVPGCVVADDFLSPLGDPSEARLAVALNYMATGSCQLAATAAAKSAPARVSPAGATQADAELFKPAWRENRILERP